MDDVTLSYDLPCSPAQAFLVYVDRIGQWWPAQYSDSPAQFRAVQIEPVVGGAVVAHYATQATAWGTVLRIEPGRLLEHTFSLGHGLARPSLVTAEFSEHDIGCRFTFTHGGWGSGNVEVRNKFDDWPSILAEYVDAVRHEVNRQR
ncbi:SRPBCC domain-containing protein [Dermacoccaceae bacterium W4C1]